MEIVLQTRFNLSDKQQVKTLRHQVSQRREGLLTRQPSSERECISNLPPRSTELEVGAGGIYRTLNKAVRRSKVWGKVFGKGAVIVLHRATRLWASAPLQA